MARLDNIESEVAHALIAEAYRITRQVFEEHEIADQFTESVVRNAITKAAGCTNG